MKMKLRMYAAFGLVLCLGFVLGGMATVMAASPARIKPVFSQALAGEKGKEVKVLELTYAPGGASPGHRHPGHTFVYVVEGTLMTQVDDVGPKEYGPGEMFYEPPMSHHAVSRNASDTEEVKAIVFMIAEKGKALTVPAGAADH